MNHLYCLIFVFFSTCSLLCQNNTEYYIFIKKADSLYYANKYMESGLMYSKAFLVLQGKGKITDRYNAARSWSMAKQLDSAICNLEKIMPFIIEYDILQDESFKPLYKTTIWDRIKSKIIYDENVVRENAVLYNDSQDSNNRLYSILKNYKCISIGEIHGTKESSEFLISIINAYRSNNKKLIVGFEINNSAMSDYLNEKKIDKLSETLFFKINFGDGKNSEAWFNAIKYCNKLNIEIIFYNSFPDSIMAQNVIDCYKTDTNVVIVTIGGNIHNRLEPYNNESTMGCYLKEYFTNKYLSIGHLYGNGTMYNLTFKGLKIRSVSGIDGVFKSALKNKSSYFILNLFDNYSKNYNAFYYTDTLTASLPIYYGR